MHFYDSTTPIPKNIDIMVPKFVIGDLHLGDKVVFKEVYSKRFSEPVYYYQALIKNWNSRVGPTDVVWVLGDLGRKDPIDVVFPQLRGIKVLIKGNHDHLRSAFYDKYFVKVFKTPVFITPRIVLSHIPIPVEDGVLNVHGHTHLIKLDSPFHLNLCPEHFDYTPVSFKNITRRLGAMTKPTYDFLTEWYKDIQILQTKREDLHINENGLIDVEKSLILIKKIKEKLRAEIMEKAEKAEKAQKAQKAQTLASTL